MAETSDRRLGVLALLPLLACACGSGTDQVASDAPAGSSDASPDAAPSPPAPRLIAPLSMTAVTLQRPVLRWEMPDGAAAPVVELCKDRRCATPLPILTELTLDGRSAAPQGALPPGWVYWRVRASSQGQTVVSATWQFWVGRSSARNPVDTGNGVTLDVNGDGFADFLVGAPHAFSETGITYLYFGATPRAGNWNGAAPIARIALETVGSSTGFGAVLAAAGDVNGDGYADFLISALGRTSETVHLYLGAASPSAADWNGTHASGRIDLTEPLPGGRGFGISLAAAGDVDGDGYSDFIVGSGPATHVYFGSAAPSASEWTAGASKRRVDLASPTAGSGFGVAVAGAGDVNGDGYADLLVGASAFTFDPGRAYLYLGSRAPGVTDWNRPTSTSRLELKTPDGFSRGFAATLARAGDINGDGYADFLIASEFADGGDPTSQTGAAHVYLGSSSPSADAWNGTAMSERVDLISPDGLGAFGSALAGAGDVNGDGFADFVIANSQVAQGRGAAHVYLGGATVDAAGWNGAVTHASRIDLFNPDGPNAHFGGSAANVGDVNADGFSDFVVGTFSNPVSSATEGAAHLYLGLANPDVASWDGQTPPMRFDLANPAGQSAAFGSAVALVTKPAHALERKPR